jgi:hypothetical protein
LFCLFRLSEWADSDDKVGHEIGHILDYGLRPLQGMGFGKKASKVSFVPTQPYTVDPHELSD